MCSREDKADIHDKNNGTPTKNVDTQTKETRIIVKENSEIKEQTAKTVNNQVRTKTENVGARAKEPGNKVKRTQQPKGASEVDVLQGEPKSELKFKGKLILFFIHLLQIIDLHIMNLKNNLFVFFNTFMII